jgi:protein O-mannosyl-transferase
MSKPMLVTMPLLLLLLDYWPLQRLPTVIVSQNPNNLWIFVIEKLPFLILSLIFCVIAIWGQKSAGALGFASKYPLSARSMNAMVSYMEYIYKTIYPANLSVIYPYPSNISLFHLMISVMILTLITCFIFFLHDQIPALLAGWFWFLITLMPVIGLIQVGTQAMADRYTYVPLIGLFISGVWGIHALIVKFRIRSWVVVLATASVIFTFSMMTINQASVWKDSQALFSHALSVTQNNWTAHLNYGEALMEKGRVDAAIRQYQQAIKINPGFEMAYLNLGVAFSKKGETDMAINYYNKTIQIKQNLPAAWLNLGNAYFRKGIPDKALSYYETALSLQPDFAEAYYGIGAVMAGRGDLQKAKKAFQQALVFDPGLTSAKTSIMRIDQKMNNNNH